MGATPDVSVIVVHYRDPRETRRCLASLPDACENLAYEVHVVDNSPSQELSPEGLGIGSGVLLHSMGRNAGLARATNRAVRAARGRYFLCLNPDVVARPGSILGLVSFADQRPSAGIVASRLENADGSLQLSCRRFYTWRHVLARRLLPLRVVNRHHLMEDYDHRRPANVDWVLGSCMLVRAEAVADVGPMDERFFLYFEDVDWCYRMHEAGWEVIYYPAVSMVHDHKRDSASPGLSRQKRAHIASFFTFHRLHGWKTLVRPPATFRVLDLGDPPSGLPPA